MSGNSTAPTDDAIACLPGIGGVSKSIFFRDVPVQRWPVAAEKDPRVPRRAPPSPSEDWTERLGILPVSIAADFLAIAKVLCPHDWLDDSVYQSVIIAIDSDAGFVRKLLQDYAELDTVFQVAPARLSVEGLTTVLESVQDTPFFRSLLRRTILHLYDDPAVWSGCGYEGVAGCDDEKPRDDIGDADWLPDPQADRGESR